MYFMRGIIQIISGWTWFASTMIAIMAKTSDVIDESISTIAALIGLAAGIVFFITALIKRKQAKVELEIKEIELQRLKMQ